MDISIKLLDQQEHGNHNENKKNTAFLLNIQDNTHKKKLEMLSKSILVVLLMSVSLIQNAVILPEINDIESLEKGIVQSSDCGSAG